MSAARIEADGRVKILDGKAEPDAVVTESDAKDPAKLARLLARLLKDIATVRRRFTAKRIDFEDVAVSTAGATVSLQHNLNGRVRWWLAGWQSSGTTAPILKESATATTAQTLVLMSYVAGTATIRVEGAG